MIAQIDGLLRGEGRYSVGRGRVPLEHLALLLALCGFLYGCTMGFFSLRPLQSLYSGLKVPLLLTCSTALGLPSFFVLNTLLGLRDDFASALRAVFAAQATVAVALLALAPVLALVYVSTESYRFAMFANGVLFALATLAGHRTMDRHYRPLVRVNPRHRIGRAAWTLLYVFVAIQFAWVLRPFVGSPDLEPTLFRAKAWSNAYIVLLRDVLGLGG